MELKDFVSETLRQIIDGLKEAQTYAVDQGASINPAGVKDIGNSQFVQIIPKGVPEVAQLIDFDIAVTVSESGEAKAGVGVLSGVINFFHSS